MAQHTFAERVIEKLDKKCVEAAELDRQEVASGTAVAMADDSATGNLKHVRKGQKLTPSGWREKSAALLVAVRARIGFLFTYDNSPLVFKLFETSKVCGVSGVNM